MQGWTARRGGPWHREECPQQPGRWTVEWGDLGSSRKRGARDPASRHGEGTEEHYQGADGPAQPLSRQGPVASCWVLPGLGNVSCLSGPVRPLRLVVDVFPPRHSARPFHHIRSSIAYLLPPHPPITLAPAASPPAVRATSFAPSPVPSSLLLSSSRATSFARENISL
jgi:hypothetical protein